MKQISVPVSDQTDMERVTQLLEIIEELSFFKCIYVKENCNIVASLMFICRECVLHQVSLTFLHISRVNSTWRIQMELYSWTCPKQYPFTFSRELFPQ